MGIAIHEDNLKSFQRVLIYIVAIFFLNRMINPSFITVNDTVANIYTVISQFFTLWYVMKFLICHMRNKKMLLSDVGIIVLCVLFFIYLLLDNLLLGGYLRRVFFVAYPIIGSICMIEVESIDHSKELLHAFSLFAFLFATLNLIDILLIRGTGSINSASSYLVGGKNQLAMFLSMSLSFFFAYNEVINTDYKTNSKLKNIFFLGIIIFNTALSRSGTCIITIGIELMLYIIYKTKGEKNLFLQPINILVLYIIAWFALIIFRLQYLFSNFITNILHKDLTLSHRTIIWDRALELIRKKPIFGYGLSKSYDVFSVYHDYSGGNNSVWTSISGHNEILQLLYYGGIVLIFILLAMYFISCSRKRRQNHAFVFMFLGVVGILINWMSEVPGEYSFFLMMAMCYWSSRFEPKNKEVNDL